MSAEQENPLVVRSAEEEHDYFLRRAEDHRRLAETNDEPDARSIHQRLQQLYQERAARLIMVLPD